MPMGATLKEKLAACEFSACPHAHGRDTEELPETGGSWPRRCRHHPCLNNEAAVSSPAGRSG